MLKKDITKRWEIEHNMRIVIEEVMQLFQSGGELQRKISSFGLIEGKADFRGINAKGKRINKCLFENVDFSFSSFKSTWVENSKFDTCRFYKVDFSDFSDHGNMFKECVFIDCKFNKAGIGYNGSSFSNCFFEMCNYSKAIFIRTEYVASFFKDCRIKNIDFNASSFEDCIFEGLLDDVWFRGGFSLKSDYEYYGLPKVNEMKNVSFEKAELKDVTFSNNCDLSTVRIDSDGQYYKYNNWKMRLEFLNLRMSMLKEGEKKEVLFFVNTHLVHAKDQDWYIINIDDLERDYGKNVASEIINGLNNFQ
ncbi:pentapeptide repeat-containing protein [Chitinophaga cymbidii]|uniref:Pentapeptide repeat protein n=1 Tax=Chitinophaga cymbidii TaxID=1096750 RepID=A0A512RLF8_9BACT|nr:pentapeptide repeat-containing protein [Chitinophaga cymbidii]GEP96526.1 hypothetical protein CCY01nite_27860 [Chitinophaga cymbidii]